MLVSGQALPRAISCEEHGVKLSAAQAAALVAALLLALMANFSWNWESPEATIDVIVFNQEPAPRTETRQPPPEPKEKKPEPEPPPPEPKPEAPPEPKPETPPKPEPSQADIAVKPEPEAEPIEETLPEPEPEPDVLSELIEELEEAAPAAPDPELIDIYRQRIKSLIERHLRIPEGTPDDAKTVLLVRLTSSGTLEGEPVVEVGSGYPEYDEEAIRAVIFAQPYPMPADPAVLNALREIKLTVRP